MTDLDALMDKDPLSLTTEDIDDIIAYHRRLRGQIEAGVKPKKVTEPGPKIELASLGLKKPAPTPVVRRRF